MEEKKMLKDELLERVTGGSERVVTHCNMCGAEFFYTGVECNDCGSLDISWIPYNESELLHCPVCGEPFRTQYYYDYHMQSVHWNVIL